MSATTHNSRQVLGLGSGADPAEVEAHYQELQSFLDLRKVPRSLRPWAIRQRALVDEAYAALAGDLDALDTASATGGESPVAVAGASAEDEENSGSEDDELAPDPDLPDEPPPVELRTQSTNEKLHPRDGFGRPAAIGHSPAVPAATTEGLLEIVTEDQRRAPGREAAPAHPAASGRPSPGQAGQVRGTIQGPGRAPSGQSRSVQAQDRASGRAASVPMARPKSMLRLTEPWQRAALGLLLGLAILGALYVGTKGLPSIGASAAQSSSPSVETRQQQAQLDQRRVADLKALADKDPTNKDVLFELGEMYIQAGKWQDSLDWFTRLLAVDPDNLHARMDVGTDNLNLGRTAEAKTAWEEVARRSPSDPQIHYNLGFLYANASGKERDVEAARREWQKVVELAPNGELARIAQSSLEALPKAAGQ